MKRTVLSARWRGCLFYAHGHPRETCHQKLTDARAEEISRKSTKLRSDDGAHLGINGIGGLVQGSDDNPS